MTASCNLCLFRSRPATCCSTRTRCCTSAQCCHWTFENQPRFRHQKNPEKPR